MIAFMGFEFSNNVKNRSVAFHRCTVDLNFIQDVANSPHPGPRIFQGHSSDNPMNFITFFEQKFCQVAAILAGDSGNECFFHIHLSISVLEWFSRQRYPNNSASSLSIITCQSYEASTRALPFSENCRRMAGSVCKFKILVLNALQSLYFTK